MRGLETESFAIMLYVPDSVLSRMRERNPLALHTREECSDLSFLHLRWWEESHTEKLGMIPRKGLNHANIAW